MITLLGTSAGAVAFQAYLVEGLARWNRERAVQDRVATDKLRSFDITLMHRVNALSTAIYDEAALTNFSTPSPYTGEVIGVKYLRLHTGLQIDKTVIVTWSRCLSCMLCQKYPSNVKKNGKIILR